MLPYFIIISVFAAVLTVYDKIAAKKLPRHRVPERVLLTAGLMGGAAAEYITMVIIRHKTRKKKFTVTLPLFCLIHLTLFIIFNIII